MAYLDLAPVPLRLPGYSPNDIQFDEYADASGSLATCVADIFYDGQVGPFTSYLGRRAVNAYLLLHLQCEPEVHFKGVRSSYIPCVPFG